MIWALHPGGGALYYWVFLCGKIFQVYDIKIAPLRETGSCMLGNDEDATEVYDSHALSYTKTACKRESDIRRGVFFVGLHKLKFFRSGIARKKDMDTFYSNICVLFE